METLKTVLSNSNFSRLLQSKRFGVFLIIIVLIAYNGDISQDEIDQAIDAGKILIGAYGAQDVIKALPFGKKSEPDA